MKLTLNYKGKKQVIDNVDIGGYIEIEYYRSDGKKMTYKLVLTKKETLLVNK